MTNPNGVTDKQINEAETKAAHAAIKAYTDALQRELGRLGFRTILDALEKTDHVHQAVAIVTGARPGFLRVTFEFDASPAAVSMALTAGAKEGRIK